MDLLAANAWPVWAAALLLGVAAAINARTLTVPNWLTLGGVLSGWVVGALASAGALPLRGGLGPSLAATAIGFGVLIPWASRGALGVGCVKAQMAFGAWLGCAADLGPASALLVWSRLAAGQTAPSSSCGGRAYRPRCRSPSDRSPARHSRSHGCSGHTASGATSRGATNQSHRLHHP